MEFTLVERMFSRELRSHPWGSKSESWTVTLWGDRMCIQSQDEAEADAFETTQRLLTQGFTPIAEDGKFLFGSVVRERRR